MAPRSGAHAYRSTARPIPFEIFERSADPPWRIAPGGSASSSSRLPSCRPPTSLPPAPLLPRLPFHVPALRHRSAMSSSSESDDDDAGLPVPGGGGAVSDSAVDSDDSGVIIPCLLLRPTYTAPGTPSFTSEIRWSLLGPAVESPPAQAPRAASARRAPRPPTAARSPCCAAPSARYSVFCLPFFLSFSPGRSPQF